MPDSVQTAVQQSGVPRLNLASVSNTSSQGGTPGLDRRCSMPTATTLATPRSAIPPSPQAPGLGASSTGAAAAVNESTFSVTPYIEGLPDADQVIGIDPHRLCLDLRRAENLHGFELTETLSEGTFGKLHRATFEKANDWIVREFPLDVSFHDIARELRYFMRSMSPYVLPVKRAITEGLNVKYVVLQSSGTTLSRWITEHFAKASQDKAKKPPYRNFVDIVACLFGALYDLHQDSVIHGNLNADTILVKEVPSSDGQHQVYLADFNLACSRPSHANLQQPPNRLPPPSQHQHHGFILDDYPEGSVSLQHEAGDSRRVCEATDNYAVGIIILKYLCRVTNYLSDTETKVTEVSMPSDHSESKMIALIEKLRESLPKDDKSTYQLLETASRSIRVDATATALNHFVNLHKWATKNEKGAVRMYSSRLFAALKEFRDSGRSWSKSQELVINSALAVVGPTMQCSRDTALDVIYHQLSRLQAPHSVIGQPMLALVLRNTCEIMRASGMGDERIIVLVAEANHVLGRPSMDPFACISQDFSPDCRARLTVPLVADVLNGTLRVSMDLRVQAERMEELIKACASSGQELRAVANLRFSLCDIYAHIGTRSVMERALFHAMEGFKYFKDLHEKDPTGAGKQDFQCAMHFCVRAMHRSAHSRFIHCHDRSVAAAEVTEAISLLKSILPADIEESQDPSDAMTLYHLSCMLQDVACRYRGDDETMSTKLLGDSFDYIQEGIQILRRARIGPHFLLVVRFELQREMLHRLLCNQSKGREGIIGLRPDSQITPDCGDSQRHQTIRRMHQILAERPPSNEEVLAVLDEVYQLEQAPAQRAKALVQKADFLMAIGQPSQAKRIYQAAMATFDRTQDERIIVGSAVMVAREACGDKAPTPILRSGERSPRSGNRSPLHHHHQQLQNQQQQTSPAKSMERAAATTTPPAPSVVFIEASPVAKEAPAAKPTEASSKSTTRSTSASSNKVSRFTAAASTEPVSPKAPQKSTPSISTTATVKERGKQSSPVPPADVVEVTSSNDGMDDVEEPRVLASSNSPVPELRR